jgi:hypothetical protein
MSNWKLIFLTLLGGVLGAAAIGILTFVLFALGDSIFATGEGTRQTQANTTQQHRTK